MEPAQSHEDAAASVCVGDLVGASRAGDIDLDHYQIRAVFEAQRTDVLIGDFGMVGAIEISGEGRQPERRKQRVLDGTKKGTGGFRKRGKDEFDEHRDPILKYFSI